MNIAEILKDKPKGTKLYSIPWGECTLEEVATSLPLLPIIVRNCLDDLQKRYTKKGTYYPSLDECLLFPSKEMRDWRKFVWKEGAILVSNDGETVVMFLEWANDAYTEFFGAKFPVKKEEGKSTFNTCDFESCCQSYNIEPCVNLTTGEFSVKAVRITVGNSEPNDTNKPIEPKNRERKQKQINYDNTNHLNSNQHRPCLVLLLQDRQAKRNQRLHQGIQESMSE